MTEDQDFKMVELRSPTTQSPDKKETMEMSPTRLQVSDSKPQVKFLPFQVLAANKDFQMVD